MTTISTDIYDKFKLQTNEEKKDNNSLAQDDFLMLMTTQLQNQDPMKPMENGEFLGQMAQFSTVSGLGDLKDSFDKLASSFSSNQTLMAAGMIGKNVLTPGNAATLGAEGEKISGAIDLPQSTGRAAVNVYDSSGTLVHQIELGIQPAGQTKFSWDGKTSDGTQAPAGRYDFRAEFAADNGETQAATTLIYAKIDSVGIKGGQISVNTTDGLSHNLSTITQIG